MFPCNYAKGVEHTSEVRWTCIHVLMHIHILNKCGTQKCGTGTYTKCNTVTPMFACNYAKSIEQTWGVSGHVYMS